MLLVWTLRSVLIAIKETRNSLDILDAMFAFAHVRLEVFVGHTMKISNDYSFLWKGISFILIDRHCCLFYTMTLRKKKKVLTHRIIDKQFSF